jgi:NAD(P)-dependent dehydrogenase (short-subunit alcohol dehydrogenase family)
VIGGSAGIGLETARLARAERPTRHPRRPQPGAPGARRGRVRAVSRAAFDAVDPAALERFFADLPTPIDHVLVGGTGGKRPGVGLTIIGRPAPR